jgi:hypothetical protein
MIKTGTQKPKYAKLFCVAKGTTLIGVLGWWVLKISLT